MNENAKENENENEYKKIKIKMETSMKTRIKENDKKIKWGRRISTQIKTRWRIE